MTQVLELAGKDIKTILITEYAQKKSSKAYNICKRLVKFLGMKIIIYEIKKILDEINSR